MAVGSGLTKTKTLTAGNTLITAAAKVVPARQTREIVIQATNLLIDLTNRTLKEVIQVVNIAVGKEKVIAVRRLRNSDTVITF